MFVSRIDQLCALFRHCSTATNAKLIIICWMFKGFQLISMSKREIRPSRRHLKNKNLFRWVWRVFSDQTVKTNTHRCHRRALHLGLKILGAQNNTNSVQLMPLYIIERSTRLFCGVNWFQFFISVRGFAEAIATRRSRLDMAGEGGIKVFRWFLPA